MKEKIRSFFSQQALPTLKEILRILALNVFPIAVGISIVIGLSFLITKNFSYNALSERLVWCGILMMMAGGIMVYSHTTGGRDFGTSGQFIRSAHVQNIIDFNIEVRKNVEKQFGWTFRLFLIGLFVFGIGILVNVLFT